MSIICRGCETRSSNLKRCKCGCKLPFCSIECATRGWIPEKHCHDPNFVAWCEAEGFVGVIHEQRAYQEQYWTISKPVSHEEQIALFGRDVADSFAGIEVRVIPRNTIHNIDGELPVWTELPTRSGLIINGTGDANIPKNFETTISSPAKYRADLVEKVRLLQTGQQPQPAQPRPAYYGVPLQGPPPGFESRGVPPQSRLKARAVPLPRDYVPPPRIKRPAPRPAEREPEPFRPRIDIPMTQGGRCPIPYIIQPEYQTSIPWTLCAAFPLIIANAIDAHFRKTHPAVRCVTLANLFYLRQTSGKETFEKWWQEGALPLDPLVMFERGYLKKGMRIPQQELMTEPGTDISAIHSGWFKDVPGINPGSAEGKLIDAIGNRTVYSFVRKVKRAGGLIRANVVAMLRRRSELADPAQNFVLDFDELAKFIITAILRPCNE